MLYASHAVSVGGLGKPRWYEIDLNAWPNGTIPLLNQSGTVDPGPGIEGFFPAIAVNDARPAAAARFPSFDIGRAFSGFDAGSCK